MATANSLVVLLARLKSGDEGAAAELWEQYFPKLVRVARSRLPAAHRRTGDEEDVALSAIDSFCRAVQNDRFRDLSDRDGLWRLLFQMTVRKVVDRVRYAGRTVRGGNGFQATAGEMSDGELLAQCIGDTPTPEFLAMMNEERTRLFDLLRDEQLQAIAASRMEGYTNREIAERLGCSLRTVERRLELVRKKWELSPRADSPGESQ